MVISRDEYAVRWSALHGGYDPRRSRWAWPWLSLAYAVARPLARAGVGPDAVTALGPCVSLAAVAAAAAGGRWAVLAAAVVVASALVDSLDGALALLQDRATVWGYVLDSLADRVSDGLYLVALWVLGAPGWLCVLAGSVAALAEYTRARAVGSGSGDIGVVTVSERPTRVVVTAMFLLGAGWWTAASRDWATAGASAWLTLGLVGLTQLLGYLRTQLRSS